MLCKQSLVDEQGPAKGHVAFTSLGRSQLPARVERVAVTRLDNEHGMLHRIVDQFRVCARLAIDDGDPMKHESQVRPPQAH
eukprot:3575431-Prymnesium_polylepis.1